MKIQRSLAVGLSAVLAMSACEKKLEEPEEPPPPPRVEPELSLLSVDRDTPALADGVDSLTVSVNLLDEDGKPYEGIKVLLSAEGEELQWHTGDEEAAEDSATTPDSEEDDSTDASENSPLRDPMGRYTLELPETDKNGVSSARLRSPKAQDVVISAKASAPEGEVELGESLVVTFVAGEPAALVFMVAPGAAQAGVKLAPALVVEAVDAHGNRAPSPALDVNLSLQENPQDAAFKGETLRQTESGLAIFDELRIEEAGTDYVVIASADSLVPIQSEPFSVTAGPPARLVFLNQPEDGIAGESLSPVSVGFVDEYGNRVRASTTVSLALIQGQGEDEARLRGNRQIDTRADQVSFEDLFIQDARSELTLVASAPNFAGAQSEVFKIEPAALERSRSKLSLTPATATADGEDSLLLQFKAADAYGNPIPKVALELRSSFTTDSFDGLLEQTGSEGSFSLPLKSTRAGPRTFTLLADETSFTSKAAFRPGPLSSSTSELSASPATLVVDGSSQLTLVLRDLQGNLIEGLEVEFELDSSHPVLERKSGVSDARGMVKNSITSISAEEVAVKARVEGEVVATTTLLFQEGKPNAENSSLDLSSTELTANGTDLVTLVFILLDTYDNPIPGEAIRVIVDGNDNVLEPEEGLSDENGVFATTLSSTRAETKNVDIQVRNETLASAVLSFVPGPPSPQTSSLVADESIRVANGQEESNLKFTLLDAHENPIPGAMVLFAGAGDRDSLEPSEGQTDAQGQLEAVLSSTKASLVEILAQVDGETVSSKTIEFIPGPPSSLRSAVSSTPAQVPADGLSVSKVQVTVLDAFDNPVPEIDVSLDVEILEPEDEPNSSPEPTPPWDGEISLVQPPLSNNSGYTEGALALDQGAEVMLRVFASGTQLLAEIPLEFKEAVSVGGTVLGLDSPAGEQLVLQLNNGNPHGTGETLTIDSDGSFSFPRKVSQWDLYRVNITTPPQTQSCVLQHGTGLATDEDVDSLIVRCAGQWSSIASGPSAQHSFAQRDVGNSELWAFGYNHHHQLGDGTELNQKSPVQVASVLEFVHVASGAGHSLAVAENGSLWAWGRNDYGQLGLGDTSPREIPTIVGTGYQAVAAGQHHSVALKTDGKVLTFGRNNYGQLGNDSTSDSDIPVQISEDGWGADAKVVAVSAGSFHTTVLRENGNAWSFGRNDLGQLADGTAQNKLKPVPVSGDLPKLTQLVAGGDFSLGLGEDGSLWAWGHNNAGQLGDTTWVTRRNAVLVGEGFRAVSAGGKHALALKSDQSLWSFGDNTFGQLGKESIRKSSHPLKIGDGFSHIAAGATHSMALRNNGSLWTFGNNEHGQLGANFAPSQNRPVLAGEDFVAVSTGEGFTVGVREDRSLWAWGRNGLGQLGDESTTTRTAPVQIATNAVAVASGRAHTLVLKADGSLWAFGDNSFGQLGDGSTQQRTSPVQIGEGSTYVEIAAGRDHSLAITSDGTLLAWGRNERGQLGINTTEAKHSPEPVINGSDFIKIAAGSDFSAGVREDGSLWAWGANDDGQLGLGDEGQAADGVQDHLIPTEVTSGFTSLSAGMEHVNAIASNGQLWGWGRNASGQIGDGSNRHRKEPVPIESLSGFVEVFAGQFHSLANTEDDALWAFGSNASGQLGTGDDAQEERNPVKIGEFFVSASGGLSHSAALRSDGTLWCFGSNGHGELGIGEGPSASRLNLVP